MSMIQSLLRIFVSIKTKSVSVLTVSSSTPSILARSDALRYWNNTMGTPFFAIPLIARYIQWLFPIREQGLNHLSYPLQIHEAAAIRNSPETQARVLTSLALMLDFYGMEISPTNSLLITRHSDRRICQKQYRNLTESYHN